MAAAAARLIGNYDDLIDAIRTRVAELCISRNELDHLAGIANGHSGKLLGPGRIKRFGRITLGPTLGAIGCKLILVEDPAATAKTLARRKLVEESQQRFNNTSRSCPTEKVPVARPKRKRPGKYD
jgi:hypothetical protein